VVLASLRSARSACADARGPRNPPQLLRVFASIAGYIPLFREGTRIHFYPPRSAAQAEQPSICLRRLQRARALAKGGKVLLVDDDSAVREVTAAMLRDLGYIVLEAGSGGGAFDLLDRERRIDPIVMDFAMPGMNGAEVARQARISRPRSRSSSSLALPIARRSPASMARRS
jgi:CheY-like chemotaxis protein